jgi:hypothetical protein
MGEIRFLDFEKKSIIEIDYSDCKEAAMVMLVDELEKELLLRNKPQLILSTFNEKNFATSKFMRHAERKTAKNIHLINKIAFVGLTSTQMMILKGYNFLFNRNFRPFDNKTSAIAYLLDESTSDKIQPEFL